MNEDSNAIIDRLQHLLDEAKPRHKQNEISPMKYSAHHLMEDSYPINCGWLELLIADIAETRQNQMQTGGVGPPRPGLVVRSTSRLWCVLNNQGEIQLFSRPPALVCSECDYTHSVLSSAPKPKAAARAGQIPPSQGGRSPAGSLLQVCKKSKINIRKK